MSIAEVLCQISTFIAAGHETTSSALTWCLYALARDRDIQDRLRHELRTLPRTRNRNRQTGQCSTGGGEPATWLRPEFDERTQKQAQARTQAPGNGDDGDGDGDCDSEMEDGEMLLESISACEYLDWVVREALRVHAPVTSTMRVCMRDRDEIPVGKEGYLDRYGIRRWSIPVKRWDIVSVPIQAVNKSRELWGEDAGVFRCVGCFSGPGSFLEPSASFTDLIGDETNSFVQTRTLG